MKKKSIVIYLFQFLFISACFSQEKLKTINENTASFLRSLVLPALIAVAGYILKSIYEVLLDRERRKRNLLEDKLKNFYWPILTRLEENEAIWRLILSKRSNLNELQKKIGIYVEENIILKNHREIMTIIMNNRFLARFDIKLSNSLKDYFKHVAIYESILYLKENTFPGILGAPYPQDFDDIIRERTTELQKRLDKKMFL